MLEQTTPFYLSRTFWLQIAGIVAMIFPKSRNFIQENLGASGTMWAVINIALRTITKIKLSLS